MKIVRAKTVAFMVAGFCLGGTGWAEPTGVTPNSPAVPQQSRLVALRVVGSTVKNPQGEYLGRIEETAVNPNTGQIEFAMLQIYYPTNTTRITPVPWKVLSYVWDQSQSGGLPGAMQTFNLNMSRAQLERAPTLDQSRWPNLGEALWRQRILAYYGVLTETAVSSSGTSGAAATEQMSAAPEPLPYEPGVYAAAGGAGSAIITDTNLIGSISNAPPFTPIPAGATNQLFNTNIFLNRTNFFINRTNFFPGTRTPFNPNDPSTFPRSPAATNFNTSHARSLPAPTPGVAPFSSAQFASTQNSGDPQLAVAPQPNPWSPRFLPPGPTPSVSPQPNQWSPRFISPEDGPSLPIASQPNNPWSPRFLSPAPADPPASSSSQAAMPPSAWVPPVQQMQAAPRAPLFQPAPARRR